MALSVQTLALSKKYTRDSLIGMGALKGAACTVKNIEKENGINKVTFEWTATDDSKRTSEMLVADGATITKVEVNEDNELIVTLSDNTSHKGGTIKTIKGDPGFSPKITANEDNTESVYRLDIETEDGVFTTANLMQGAVPVIEF